MSDGLSYDINDPMVREVLPADVLAHAEHLAGDVWNPACRWCNPIELQQ